MPGLWRRPLPQEFQNKVTESVDKVIDIINPEVEHTAM